MHEEFDIAVDNTRRVIEQMTDTAQGLRRIGLLESICAARAQGSRSLLIGPGERCAGQFLDVVVLGSDETVPDYAVDMRLVALVASLEHPDVLTYINNPFPPYINPANDSRTEATAERIRENPNLIGLWELSPQATGGWNLQLVCPDGHTKPVHGTLLIR